MDSASPGAVTIMSRYARRISGVCGMPSAAKRLSAVGLLSSIASRPLPSAVSAAAVAFKVSSFMVDRLQVRAGVRCNWKPHCGRRHELGVAAIRAPEIRSLAGALRARPLGMWLADGLDGRTVASSSTVRDDHATQLRKTAVQLGMIGLGRMGANMARRVMSQGHQCVVQDGNADAVARMVSEGAVGAATLQEMASKMARPPAVWMMVPAAVVDHVLDDLVAHLDPGDIIIDGGNSYYRDDIDRAKRLKDAGYHYVDCGTSGGIAGQDRGYCLMVGAEPEIFDHLSPIFKALAPGVETASRTPGRTGEPTSAEQGFLHCGPNGAGHFVKMVHNGIEYGMMAAFAEGFNILRHANIGKQVHAADAETTPMREPEFYQYDFDLPQVAELWRRGSVVGSWLLDLTAKALLADPQLAAFGGKVSDSGEGRWTLQAAIDEAVPTHVLSAAVF